jgi:PAS domain S-box-containing protein
MVTEQSEMPDISNKTKVRSDSLFSAVFQHASIPMAISLMDGTFIDINPSFLELLGYSREEILYRSSKDLDLFVDYSQRNLVIEAVQKHGFARNHEVLVNTKNKEVKAGIFSAEVIKVVGEIFLLTMMVDITERREFETKLQSSEEIFRSVFENINDGVLILDITEKRPFLVNNALLKMLGYTHEEISTMDQADMHPTDDLPDVISMFGDMMRQQASYAKDVPFKRKDDSIIYFDISNSLTSIAGKPYLVSTYKDTTERKKVEEKLDNYHHHLEQLVKQRTNEIERKNLELIAKNQELERFAYIASHDLQEPLRTVTSYLQILDTDFVNQLDQPAKEYIQYAVDGAKSMKDMLSGLFEYYFIGIMESEFTSLDLNKVLKETLDELNPFMLKKHAKVHSEFLPFVIGNKQLLKTVFKNLIDNAIKFKGDHDPVIKIYAKIVPDNEWQIFVADNGIGIDKKYHSKVFELFQRLNGREKYTGTGIGLTIAKRIVEKHHGKIWVDSEPGIGTKVIFSLPLMRSEKNEMR